MQPLTLYLLTIFLLGFTAIMTRFGKLPVFWIFGPWVLAFAPIWSGVISYSNPPVDTATTIFVVIHLCIMSFGYIVVLHRGQRSIISIDRRISYVPFHDVSARKLEFLRLKRIIDILVAVGISGSILFIVDALFVTGFAQSNAFETRALFVESNVNILRRIAPILAMGNFIALFALFWFGSNVLGKRLKWYAFAAFSVVFFSILSAGRQAIFQLILFSFIAWILKKRSKQIKNIRPSQVLLSFIFLGVSLYLISFMIGLSSERSFGSIESQVDILLSIFGAELYPQVEDIIRGQSAEFGTGLVSGLLYFSSQLSSLAAIHDPSAANTWGIGIGFLYEFPWFYRRLEILGLPSIDSLVTIRRGYLASTGYMSVSWSTALSSFLHDFGYYGSFVYSFVVGCFGGWIFRNFRRKQSFFAFCLLVESYGYLFYMIMFSLSSDTIYFFLVSVTWYLDRRYSTIGHLEKLIHFSQIG